MTEIEKLIEGLEKEAAIHYNDALAYLDQGKLVESACSGGKSIGLRKAAYELAYFNIMSQIDLGQKDQS